MPAIYAHYRFGVQALEAMPADTRRTVQRFRRLYDVGVHGPDLFFYHSPLPTRIGALGHKYHHLPGNVFFGKACRSIRLDWSEATESYLYGLLAHYALDSVAHPRINEFAGSLGVPHVRIESEFDRYLLELDGREAHMALTPHLKLTSGELDTVARFYPPASGGNIGTCLRHMVSITKLLTAPEGTQWNLVHKVTGIISPNLADLMIPPKADPVCSAADEPLKALYDTALHNYTELLSQLRAHLSYSAPLGELFAPTFE